MILNSFKFLMILSFAIIFTGCVKLDPTMNQLTISTKKIDENIYLKSNYEKVYTQVKFEDECTFGLFEFEAVNNMLNHYKGDFLTDVTIDKGNTFCLHEFLLKKLGITYKIEADVWRYKKDK